MGTTDKYSECIALLEANKNLILTGAPGTGKTYLAREIATAMGAEWEFVQFHPSYDYTDFVEGLRPTPPDSRGNIGFERKNGVFKEFCKRAIEEKENIQPITPNDTSQSVAPNNPLKKETNTSVSFETVYQSIVEDIRNRKIQYTNWRNCKPFKLEIRNGRIWYENRFEKEDNIKRMYEYCVAKNKFDISYWGRDDFFDLAKKVTNTASTVDYTLYGWILQELLSRTKKLKSEEPKSNTIQKQYFSHPDILPLMQSTNNASNISRPITFSPKKASKPFVFIIDEINRGEISKIFGELFFSIDPGYRGKSGRVKTQYQNMITDEHDPFYEGFYVPKNVYIIGTMNDIDRSVESMDFAMRRRFAWKEIKANENTGMLDSFRGLKNEIISKMNRLNNAIWNEETNEGIEGLSAAYHIGGAYFKKLELYDYENNLPEAYQQLWENHLRGVLFEYLRGSFNAAENLKKLEEVYYSEDIHE